MPSSPFFTLHRDLPREGPGEAADVHWAVGELSPKTVIDAACGPGADTVTLAEALPQARILGVDKTTHFVAAARERTARFGARVRIEQGDMADLSGPVDFIWCAGALYFLGVEEGLTAWRSVFAPGAMVAFSHPVTRADDPPDVAAFWDGEPGVGPQELTEAAISAAGYDIAGFKRIVGRPWANYYHPKEARIAKLRADGASPELEEVLQRSEREIAIWRAHTDRIAYGLWLVHPR